MMDVVMNANNSLGKSQKQAELCLMNPKILYHRIAIHSFTLKPENASLSELIMLLCIILTARNRLNQPSEGSIFKAIMTPMITCSGCCVQVRV